MKQQNEPPALARKYAAKWLATVQSRNAERRAATTLENGVNKDKSLKSFYETLV